MPVCCFIRFLSFFFLGTYQYQGFAFRLCVSEKQDCTIFGCAFGTTGFRAHAHWPTILWRTYSGQSGDLVCSPGRKVALEI